MFIGNVNSHQEKWLRSSTTTVHGRTARDIASSSSCNQMLTETTHIDGGLLDLVLTDAPELVGIRVGSSVGTSNHSAVFIDVVLE